MRRSDPVLRAVEFNLVAALASIAFLGGAYALTIRSGWILVLMALIAGVAVTLVGARSHARAGRRSRAIWLTVGANLVAAPVVVAIVPDVLAPLVLVALLQVVLAIDVLSERQFAAAVGAAFVSLLLTAIAGRTQGARSLRNDVSMTIVDVVVVAAVPAVAALVTVLIWQHRRRLADQAAELRRSRSRLATVADRERRRLERDLHDGAQQQLVAAAVQVPTIRALIGMGRAPEADELLDRVEQRLRGAIDDLRRLARGLYPPVLATRGLADALGEVVTTVANPTVVRLGTVPRLPPEVETAIYYCCLEALQNATKHAPASTITVELAGDVTAIRFRVADDGPGFDPTSTADGTGLLNMADRIDAAGGELTVAAWPGAGTVVAGSVPVVGIGAGPRGGDGREELALPSN
jgi:signal transduction histidine kinase